VERVGYYLWEGITLFIILFVATSLLVLRRKAGGRPVFTDYDRELFFGRPAVRLSTPRFYINFSIAVFVCYLAGSLEYLILARFGASILATAQLITFLGIVKKSLC
jgi:hypothetical protein